MTFDDRAMLESEIAMLDEMLAKIGSGRVIERVGLEARAQALRAQLSALGEALPRVLLTFRGEPVIGTRAILAEFGGRAAALFSEAVATVSASLSTQLGSAGPLPQGMDRQLRIVGTAVGSFGFQLELPQPEALPGLLPEMPEAVESTLALIRGAQAGDEDALSELIAGLHPRAAAKVHAFVKHVVDRNAGFAVSFGEQRAAVRDPQEGRAVLEALREDHIQQQEIAIEGALSGVLPDARRFEARRASDGALLSGRIDRSAGDPDELLTTWRGKPARLQVRETRVRSARPSYVLLAIHATNPS
jgi:hypothetical protein